MTESVVEVGPAGISGVNDAPPEWIATALECIDDTLALLDERLVSVQELWQDVMRLVAGGGCETLIAVCPTWWPPSRTDRVHEAAQTVATTVVLRQRTAVLRRSAAPRRVAVVELADDFVVVTPPDVRATVIARQGDATMVADAVVSAVGISPVALIDAPTGVADADRTAALIADRLRGNEIEVLFADEYAVRRAASRSPQNVEVTPRVGIRRRNHRAAAAVVGAVSAAAVALGGIAVHSGTNGDSRTTTVLVEGRVGMVVPADWPVRHVTSGPGSARLQLTSPSHEGLALHLTQSTAGPHDGLTGAANSLRAALDTENDGAFVDFNAAGQRAGRDAVTYREVRPAHAVAWAVLVDGAVRIAIGCQSPAGAEHLVREVCDQAIRSAHAVR
ncbi:type VII secretion-associated protein [Mycolicibacterium elephantis]|uniref:Type VII secretion-associated protein n=1 Tax=Mycolicibacterium elephantis TaxID=81858 RepID=A0A1X0CU85_9MYCO|nr:type VII secretion-associated protein [Mycolicibacterium elephantis]OBA89380.1 type VII secretion-associated protein [Mycolicibacterium elephantis]ORA63737.1 type VII secretion-associated protein [Mycolicibacterium elephantis]